jgi:hypothetical protein
VDHGHLETTDSLTTDGGYVLGGTLVITLRRGGERYVHEREREKGKRERGGISRRDKTRGKIKDGGKEGGKEGGRERD